MHSEYIFPTHIEKAILLESALNSSRVLPCHLKCTGITIRPVGIWRCHLDCVFKQTSCFGRGNDLAAELHQHASKSNRYVRRTLSARWRHCATVDCCSTRLNACDQSNRSQPPLRDRNKGNGIPDGRLRDQKPSAAACFFAFSLRSAMLEFLFAPPYLPCDSAKFKSNAAA